MRRFNLFIFDFYIFILMLYTITKQLFCIILLILDPGACFLYYHPHTFRIRVRHKSSLTSVDILILTLNCLLPKSKRSEFYVFSLRWFYDSFKLFIFHIRKINNTLAKRKLENKKFRFAMILLIIYDLIEFMFISIVYSKFEVYFISSVLIIHHEGLSRRGYPGGIVRGGVVFNKFNII